MLPEVKQLGANRIEVRYPRQKPIVFVNTKPIRYSDALNNKESILYSLHPAFQPLATRFLDELSKRLPAGAYILITDAFRTPSEQQKLYVSNPQYAKSAWNSPHNFGLALDFSVIGPNGQAITNRNDIMSIVDEIARKVGIYWGGWFVSMPKEPWHIQIARDWKKVWDSLVA